MYKTHRLFSISLWIVLFINNYIVCFDIADESDDERNDDEVVKVYSSTHLIDEEASQNQSDQKKQLIRAANGRKLQTTAQIADLLLINADTNLPFTMLVDGLILDLKSFPTSNFNIQATVTSGTIGSVRFGYNTTTNYQTENSAPYAFCGNSGTDYYACSILKEGFHTIRATSYSGTQASGTIGSIKQASFKIIKTASTAAPSSKAPTGRPSSKAPTGSPSSKAPTDSPVTKAPTDISSSNAPIDSPVTKAPTDISSSNAPTDSPSSKFPTKAPTRSPTKSPISLSRCKVPKFTSTRWDSIPPAYPIITAETQGGLVGTDLVFTGGFINSFSDVTKLTYARSINNVATSTWNQMDDMPGSNGTTHAPAVVIGNKMYLCGGYFGREPGRHADECYIFDKSKPSGTQWSPFPSLPLEGTGGGAMMYDTLRNMMFYTGGARRPITGSIVSIDSDETWKISLDDFSAGWLPSTPMPYLGNHLSFVTVNYLGEEERHYVLGGQRGEFEKTSNIKEVYEFHANNETWSRKADMPFPRGHASISTHQVGLCGFIIAGGAVDGGRSFNRTNQIHFYHIPTNQWSYMGNLNQKAATPPVTIGQDDFMYHTTGSSSVRRKFAF